jgi:hypothetical protein
VVMARCFDAPSSKAAAVLYCVLSHRIARNACAGRAGIRTREPAHAAERFSKPAQSRLIRLRSLAILGLAAGCATVIATVGRCEPASCYARRALVDLGLRSGRRPPARRARGRGRNKIAPELVRLDAQVLLRTEKVAPAFHHASAVFTAASRPHSVSAWLPDIRRFSRSEARGVRPGVRRIAPTNAEGTRRSRPGPVAL